MKLFVAIASLALALSSFTNAEPTASADDLKAAFLRWKASPAGQQAYESGFVPPTSSSNSNTMSISSVDEPTPDELARFQSSLDRVERLQKEQPLVMFSVDTPFALLTPDEFKAYVGKSNVQGHIQELQKLATPLATVPSNTTSTVRNLEAETFTTTTAAATTGDRNLRAEVTWSVNVDWQTKGCVTDIKNQGNCGVCWAFSATAALESGYCANKGSLPVLSEQEYVSCSRPTASCDGFMAAGAYDWMTRMNGGSICTAASYPYVSGNGDAPACKRYTDPSFQCDKPNLGAYFYGGGLFGDHTQLEAAVLKQPVAMSIHAGADAFASYKGGLLMGNEQTCSAEATDHEVLVVGFGTRDGIPYWKIKNQWGSNWGDNGYMYIERGYQGHKYGACGVEYYGYYPVFRDSSDPGLSKRTTPARWGYGI
ncbi:hypothetical protein Gpo141_00013649, partial [Globisporangium polare]